MAKARSRTKNEKSEARDLFARLVERYGQNNPGAPTARLEEAFELASAAHTKQVRESGEPYILHPLNVAFICTDLNMDEDSIVAALLHDTVEDTSVRPRKIERSFGEKAADLVIALTKIHRIDLFSRFVGRTMSDEQARNLQRLFVSMAQDLRVLVIKLADRLHNLRTIEALPEERAKRNAKETLDFYAPLARRLGLHELAHEMEDICFRLLHPRDYEWVVRELDKMVGRKTASYELTKARMARELAAAKINVKKVFGRTKTPYSTWRKIRDRGVPLDQVFDLMAIRVVVSGEELDCYRALGVIHGIYRPLFNRFRDFIAAPKSNGYQSLHTTVMGESGQISEIQIRTERMDDIAEHGVAAHWRYKGHAAPYQLRETFSWFEFISDLSEQELDSRDFVEKTRESLTKGEVLVLSPLGEVVALPEGATPIDFAYYIHTDLGHSTANALVNGKDVPLDYTLKNGDVVEIVKNKEGTPQPQPEWLNIVRSQKSIAKIKRWFRDQPRQKRVQMGRFLLRQQIARSGLYPLNLMENVNLMALVKSLRVRKIDDMFDQIATGSLMAEEVVQKLKQVYVEKAMKRSVRPESEPEAPFTPAVGLAGELGIMRKGGKPLRRKVELSPCCTPVPGDEILGLDNRKEHRVDVHLVQCPAITHEAELTTIPVQWSDEALEKFYPATLRIVALNRVGLLFDIMRELSELSVNLTGGNINIQPTVSHGDGNAVFYLMVEVWNTEQLDDVVVAIGQVEDVILVQRHHQSAGGA
jgi:GTP pyrophosphokinase